MTSATGFPLRCSIFILVVLCRMANQADKSFIATGNFLIDVAHGFRKTAKKAIFITVDLAVINSLPWTKIGNMASHCNQCSMEDMVAKLVARASIPALLNPQAVMQLSCELAPLFQL